MSYQFGQVLIERDEYSVFLAFSNEHQLYYLAKILNKEMTQRCNDLLLHVSKSPKTKKDLI